MVIQPTPEIRRCVLYLRLSEDRDGDERGIDRQREDCLALADRLGWPVAAIYPENDTSAYTGKRRKQYLQMCSDLDQDGAPTAVIAWHTDRLHRTPRELEEFIDLSDRRSITTVTCKAGPIDLSTPSGRAVARTMCAWARFESEHKAERQVRARQQAAQDGRYTGGPRTFGLLPGHEELHEEQAEELRRAARTLLAGGSLNGILADMERRGIRTNYGNPFVARGLRKALTRPGIAGHSTYKGEIVGETAHPAILTEEEWRGVCAILGDPSRRTSPGNQPRWLLSMIATCGVCTRGVQSCSHHGHQTYKCPKSAHVMRRGAIVNGIVEEAVIGLIASEPSVLALEREDATPVYTEAASLRAQLDEAAAMFAAGTITGSQLGVITGQLRERLEVAEARIARIAPVDALAPFRAATAPPAVVWDGLDLMQQRAVVRQLVTVTIHPQGSGRRKDGTYHDAEAIKVARREQK